MDFKEILGLSLGSFTVGKVCEAVITLVICVIAARIVLRIINRVIDKLHVDKTILGFLRIVIKAVVWFVVILIVAESLGISTTSLLAVFSVMGLAVSLAAEKSLSNIAGGVMVLVNKPFVVGEFIEIGGKLGTVKEVGLAYTLIGTVDNKDIYIPNSDVAAANIINYTREEKRRVDYVFTSSYDCPIAKVKEALKEAVDRTPSVIYDPEPFVAVSDYKDSSIEYTVRVWTKTETYWDVYFALIEEVKHSFDRNGIEMTYNHINVHMMEK